MTPDNEELNATFALNYLQLGERLPDYESPRRETGPFGYQFIAPSIWHDNKNFWREYAEYVRVRAALIEMKFVLRNRSEMQLSNAKLEVSVEPLDEQGFQMLSGVNLPIEPESQWSPVHGIRGLPDLLDRQNARLVVDDGGLSPICHVRFGSLLPGEEGRSSDTLAIIPFGPGRLRLFFRVLGGELAAPQESERVLEASGVVRVLDVPGLDELWARSLVARDESSGE